MFKRSFTRISNACFPLILASSLAQPSFAANVPVIVITPSSVEQPRNEAGIALTVIDAATIKKSQAHNLAELLRGSAGLHVSDLFGDGSQARLDLRGFGPSAVSNTLVLVNGRKLNNSSDTGTPDLSTIELANIDQIEILQGSAGVMYGNQAVGGVINIITRKKLDDSASVKLDMGSFKASKLTAMINRQLGQTQLSLVASDAQSDNYRDHNESDKQHVGIKLERQHSSFSAFVELASTDEYIQTPGALLQSELDSARTQSLSFYDKDYFDTRTDVISLGLEKPISDLQKLNVDFSKRTTDREYFQSFRPNPAFPPFSMSLANQDRDTQTLSAKYRINSDRLTTILGLSQEETDYSNISVIGPQVMGQTIQDLYVMSHYDVSMSSQIQAGWRHSDQEAAVSTNDFDDTVSVFSLGYRWLHQQWKLTARADQNYRYPTVEEHTNVPFGQPLGLKTQKGISYELGIEYLADKARYRTTLYSIHLDDEIGFDSSGFSNLNIDATRRKGLIVEYDRNWSSAFNSRISLTLLDAEITNGAFKGNDLPLVPQQTLRIDGGYQFSTQWRLGVELVAVGKQSFGGDFANQLEKMPSYEVLNSHVAYSINHWDFSIRVNNLLDEEYSESGSVFSANDPVTFAPTQFASFFPSPERNYWLSAKYRF